jgi:hypothetical protein
VLLGNEFKAAADEIELILSEAEGEELVRAVFSELELMVAVYPVLLVVLTVNLRGISVVRSVELIT